MLGLTLLIGSLGGGLFTLIGFPLAFLLGSMAATGVASLNGVPCKVPPLLRKGTLAIVGGLIGTSFTPATLARMGEWPLSVAAMAVFVVVISLAGALYFRLRAGYLPLTALLASVPGGLSIMIAMADDFGADERKVALAHTIRVVIIVFMIPLMVTVVSAPPAGGGGLLGVGAAPGAGAWGDVWELFASAAVGLVIALLVRAPAPYIVGPMIASALIHMTGLSTAQFPPAILIVSFIVIGASVGARFVGTTLAELMDTGKHSALATVLALGVSAVLAWLIAQAFGFDYLATLLAFAPGGVYEMALIAIGFDIDPAFVAFHHLVRLALIVVAVPLLMPRLARSVGRRR